jgi:hypothetical protein
VHTDASGFVISGVFMEKRTPICFWK